jgi:type VI secretion system protein VasG
MVDAILTNTVLPRIGHELLTRMADGTPTRSVKVSATGNEFQIAFG